MARSVPEWIGSTDDAKVPKHVKLRIWRRDANPEGFAICHISGLPIRAGDEFELEHKKALILGGQHRESNLAFALTRFHRQKTADEMAIRADTAARAISYHGLDGADRTGLEGRTPAQRRAAKDRRPAEAGKFAMPPRRPLYADKPSRSQPPGAAPPHRSTPFLKGPHNENLGKDERVLRRQVSRRTP